MPFIQQPDAITLSKAAAPRRSAGTGASNHNTRRRRSRTIAVFAYIASFITAFAAFAPLQAQALVAGGDFGKAVKKAHKRPAALPSIPDMYRPNDHAATAIIPASLGGMARSAPMGIYRASPNIATSCFRPRLIGLLSYIQRQYHRPVIVTSGYRGIVHNIHAGGVRGSLHTTCSAADIKVPGVGKYQLAAFVRSLPDHGGIGLYCHQAVHVDIGSPREWNWCNSRKR